MPMEEGCIAMEPARGMLLLLNACPMARDHREVTEIMGKEKLTAMLK